ncbi:MAG TPA: hypothetical protein VNW04_06985 [Puia sp.]|nr:hypothetical protein [Puia sp.]
MPLAFFALEKMDSLHIDREISMLTDSAYSGQTPAYTDTSSADGLPGNPDHPPVRTDERG